MRVYIFIFLFLAGASYAKAETFSRFEENGKVGLKNEAGTVIIPATYEALGWSNGSFSTAGNVTGYKLKGSWGVVSLTNEHITSPEYSSLLLGEGSLLIASKQSAAFKITTGCINTDGKVVIPFVYTGVTTVHSLRVVAFVREGNVFKHGLLDLENKILIPFQYRDIYPIGSLRYAVEDMNGKTALFSESGRQISGFTIDSISRFSNNLAIVYENGKKGLINREGQLISEAKYRDIKIGAEQVLVKMPDEWHVLNANNSLQQTIEADSITSLGEKRFEIKSAGVVNLADESLKIIQSDNFSNLAPFANGRAVFKSGYRYGVIRKDGSKLLNASFEKIILSDSYIITSEKNIDKKSWSLRDTLGVRKHTKSYDLILKNQGSIFPVKKNGYWGAINSYGKELIACVYDTLLEICENQLAVKFKGQYGIISMKEEWLVFPQPYPIRLLNQDRYWRQKENTTFLCTFNGTVLYFTINPIDIKEDHFVEHIHSGGSWVIDFDGRIFRRELPPLETAEKIFPASEGLRAIKKNGKFGFIDDQGRLRIANRYEDVKPFSEGLAAMKIRNKWGFINRDETITIQPVYEDVQPFKDGYSMIKQHGQYGVIDHQGKMLLQPRYTQVTKSASGRFELTQGQVKGLADAQGNLLLFPKYDSVVDLNNGFVIVQQNGKFGLVTLKGVSTIPIMYDFLMYEKEKDRFLALKKSEWIILPKS